MTSVQTRSLASAMRRAGVTEVEDGTRRRAEYSTDASNYRVVPQVVVFPRSADEVAAVVGVARAEGVPLTSRQDFSDHSFAPRHCDFLGAGRT